MRILFIHQNFPGQFKFLAPALARNSANTVVAMPMSQTATPQQWQGVQILPYRPLRGSTPGVHPWVSDFETKTIRAESCLRAALQLKQQGFIPDVIIAHPGWGESQFLKQVWPKARLGIYCEFFYHASGFDVGFDPEFPQDDPEGTACRIQLKNLNSLLHFPIAEAGIAPTQWQASTFPEPFRSRIQVIHDGIDSTQVTPNPHIRLSLKGLTLTRQDEVITFVNRNLEPYRGYHIFMRSLPALLRQRPKAQVLIVGGNEISYGAAPTTGQSWCDIFANEVRSQISEADWSRVHFLGNLAYEHFIALLQLSRVHVYLTYPFVLSWSLLEAMSAGCAIVASDTPPLHEVIHPNQTGRLVDFFDVPGLTQSICDLLEDTQARQELGQNARQLIQSRYDLHRVCLPQQLAWVEQLAAGSVQ